ncbi:uncharacterized protein K441DRAFT_693798 [Cenococcum geophilum 1.58]|uniref:uncharacterized protein n=1 Tax=Cenococcum geophilum 1.58 TaxID=794803 RepID=UPI00358FFC06|nr:hypothetical protein K441DRAFT_693798 [Cenococcum geophilum 1.58]
MRFTLPTLSALILLTWHQALALPGMSPSTPNTKEAVWNLPRAALYDAATHQMLDSRAVDVEATDDLDTRSLQTRAIPWQSADLKRRLVVGLSTAVATSIHLANAALTWKFSLVYHTDLSGRETLTSTLYEDGETKLQNVNLCVKGFTSSVSGNTANGYWVDADVDLEGSYVDTASGNAVTMFWTAAMRLGQYAASNYVQHMVHDPTGYERIPEDTSQMCLIPGGTSVNPTSWTFDAWT